MLALNENRFSQLSDEIMLLIIERLALADPFILFNLMQIDRRFSSLIHDALLIKKVIDAWFANRKVPITAATLQELSHILRMVMLGMNSDLSLKAKKAALISRKFNPNSILVYGRKFSISDLLQLPNLLQQLRLRDADCIDSALAEIISKKKPGQEEKKFSLSLVMITLCRAFSFPSDEELDRLTRALTVASTLFSRSNEKICNFNEIPFSTGCDFFNFERIWRLLLTSKLNVSLQVLASSVIQLLFKKRADDLETMGRLIKFMMQAQPNQFYDPAILMEVAVNYVGVRRIQDLRTLFSEDELIVYLRLCFIRSCITENAVFFQHIVHFFKERLDILRDYARALINDVYTSHVAIVLYFFLRHPSLKLTQFVSLILEEAVSFGEGKLAFILKYVVDGRCPNTLSYILSNYLLSIEIIKTCIGASSQSNLIVSFRNKPTVWHALLRDLRDNPSGNWACTTMFLQAAERKGVNVFGQHYSVGLEKVSLFEIIKRKGQRWGASHDEQSEILEFIKNKQPGNNPRTAPVSLLWRDPSEAASQAALNNLSSDRDRNSQAGIASS